MKGLYGEKGAFRAGCGDRSHISIFRASLLAILLAVVFCFPVTAAKVTADVSGATYGEAGGFGQAAVALWYLAEGSTAGGMETWVVVQNPNDGDVVVDLTFMTNEGKKDGPQDVTIPGKHRQSFLLNSLVPNMRDVSTKVQASKSVICARAVYGPGRAWAHESVGTPLNSAIWYLPEGSTYGGMETWVVVMNPFDSQIVVNLTFVTNEGQKAGPQNVTILGGYRQAFLLNSLVPNMKDVATCVQCTTGFAICESSVYGPGRTWAQSSIGFTNHWPSWYLAEGTTYGGMETWVVVMNPAPFKATVNLTFMTNEGEKSGPQGVEIEPYHRQAFLLNSLVPNMKDVATKVVATEGAVVCGRAVYGPGRAWAHGSVGFPMINATWHLAEGTTYGGMETWVVVMNVSGGDITVDLTFYTNEGEKVGPQDVPILAGHRQSFLLNSLVPNMKDVATKVTASAGVVCEQIVYGPGKFWAQGSIGYLGAI